MTTALKAIETVYRGYRFRSRLEARWAVFFDAFGGPVPGVDWVPWEYEKEGYDLGDAGPYLPDFWLPAHRVWVEIKGQPPDAGETAKARRLVEATGYPVVLFRGLPGEHAGAAVALDLADHGGGLGDWDDVRWFDCGVCGRPDVTLGDDRHAIVDHRWERIGNCWCGHHGEAMAVGAFGPGTESPRLARAYAAARSARFEHGESGAGGGSRSWREGRAALLDRIRVQDDPPWHRLAQQAVRAYLSATPERLRRFREATGIGPGIAYPRSEEEARRYLDLLEDGGAGR